MAVLLGCCF